MREDVNVAGVHPSFDPTVLKYPAEKPPVNAPCNLLRPRSSRTYRGISVDEKKGMGSGFEGGGLLVSKAGRRFRRRGFQGRVVGEVCHRKRRDCLPSPGKGVVVFGDYCMTSLVIETRSTVFS